MNREYNDYELLYLINCNNDEEALEIMFKKYEGLIYKKAKSFHFISLPLEDALMEGKMVLFKAIKTFNDKYNKTFTKYFELLLVNRLINLSNYDKKTQIIFYNNEYEFMDPVVEPVYEIKVDEKLLKEKLSKVEYQIYILFYKDNLSVVEISQKINRSKVSVSNTIQRVKKKLKELIKIY